MLSVGGNNYRPPLERSKSAPKLMAIEEAEDDDEEREEVQYDKSHKRYSQVGSVGRRSWLNRTSFSAVEAPAEGDEEEGECAVGGGQGSEEGHEIDELVQESSFKLTPSISRYEEDDEEEETEGDRAQSRLTTDCDKEEEGLEGEIMSYFEQKLNERSGSLGRAMALEVDKERKMRNLSLDCLLDTDDIISHLIRNQPPPARNSLASLTSPAASEPDEPESLRYQIDDLDSDADSDQPRLSPSIESDDSTGKCMRHYPGKGIQLSQFSEESSLEMDLQKKVYITHHTTDSDSDVSDESGFIEYQDHKYPINSDINKADNSILV